MPKHKEEKEYSENRALHSPLSLNSNLLQFSSAQHRAQFDFAAFILSHSSLFKDFCWERECENGFIVPFRCYYAHIIIFVKLTKLLNEHTLPFSLPKMKRTLTMLTFLFLLEQKEKNDFNWEIGLNEIKKIAKCSKRQSKKKKKVKW